MTRGTFITFEGGEGAGKSTQVVLLADRLRAVGNTVVVTREPGGSPFAERVRELLLDPATPAHTPLAEALLFQAARADHLDKTIRPALASGAFVISDRFADSTRVYQGAAGGVAERDVLALERLAVAGTMPALTIIIDLAPETGLARATARRGVGADRDAYEKRDLAFHQRLRQGFLAIARAEPERCIVVDGALDRAAISEQVWQAVRQRCLGGN
jgi:dTMP kinase